MLPSLSLEPSLKLAVRPLVVNEKFGIRLTDVISPAERIRKLK